MNTFWGYSSRLADAHTGTEVALVYLAMQGVGRAGVDKVPITQSKNPKVGAKKSRFLPKVGAKTSLG